MRRGLCAGLVAGSYGVGTALTIAPIAAMIKGLGFQETFVIWGVIQGLVTLVCASLIATPPQGWTPPGYRMRTGERTPWLGTPHCG